LIDGFLDRPRLVIGSATRERNFCHGVTAKDLTTTVVDVTRAHPRARPHARRFRTPPRLRDAAAMAAVAPARASVALRAPNALARRDRAAATRSSDMKSSKSSSSSSRTVVVARAAGDRRSAKSIAIEPEVPSRRDVLLGGGVLATIPLLLYGSTDHSLNAVEEIPVAAALRRVLYTGSHTTALAW